MALNFVPRRLVCKGITNFGVFGLCKLWCFRTQTRPTLNQRVSTGSSADSCRQSAEFRAAGNNDPGRHVFAAAICGRADVIVTYNVRDFPDDVLKPKGIDAQHPDDFIRHLIDLHAGTVVAAVRAQRETLTKPPRSARELLDTFLQQQLTASMAALEPYIDAL